MQFDTTAQENDNDFDPVEDGLHICQIVKAVARVSGNGNPMIMIMYKVVGDEDSDFGKKFPTWITLATKDRGKLKPNEWGMRDLRRICNSARPKIHGNKVDPGDGLDPTDQASLWDNLLGVVLKVKTEQEESGKYTNIKTRGFSALSQDKIDDVKQPNPSYCYGNLVGDVLDVEGYDYDEFEDTPMFGGATSQSEAFEAGDIPF